MLLMAAIMITVCAQTNDSLKDADAIKQVIQTAYVDGIQNNGEIEAIERGFHPDFEMLILRNNVLSTFSISKWIESIRRRKADPTTAVRPEVSCKFLNIDVTGDAAVAKLELYQEGKLLFTDYICLYRFDEGWTIVSKLFYRH